MHLQLKLNYRYSTVFPSFLDIFESTIKEIIKCNLQVRVNDSSTNTPLFSSGVIGKDNAIARHGIHGLHWLFNVNLQGNILVEGENTIYLTQANSTSPFQGIMYDYIRLEGPPSHD